MLADPFQKKTFFQQPDSGDNGIDSLTIINKIPRSDSATLDNLYGIKNTEKTRRHSLELFAMSVTGAPYLYSSADPARGFDCSGFITYVFNHFKIAVPRSSYEFANGGIKRTLANCHQGDVIIFTGTGPQQCTIGHIEIVCEIVSGMPSFIHSSSGKANGATVTSNE